MAGAGRGGDYRGARIGAALALTGVTVLLLVVDAVNPEYTVDHLVLASLLAAIGTLLGIEGISALRHVPPSHEPPHVTAARRNAGLPEVDDDEGAP